MGGLIAGSVFDIALGREVTPRRGLDAAKALQMHWFGNMSYFQRYADSNRFGLTLGCHLQICWRPRGLYYDCFWIVEPIGSLRWILEAASNKQQKNGGVSQWGCLERAF